MPNQPKNMPDEKWTEHLAQSKAEHERREKYAKSPYKAHVELEARVEKLESGKKAAPAAAAAAKPKRKR